MKPLSRTSVLAIFILLLTACASSPPTTEAPAPAEATEHTDHPTEATAPAEEETEGSSDDATVSIANFSFGPDTLTVKAGTTVTWRNNEDAPHTVTADDGSFSSSTLGQGDSFSFTFDTPGTYDYHCQFHGGAGHTGMSGTIVVED